MKTRYYNKNYKGPRPLVEQVAILAKIFGLSPDLANKFIKEELPKFVIPVCHEGWFAIPSIDGLAARFFPEVEDPYTKYCMAAQVVLREIGKSRNLYNRLSPELLTPRMFDPQYFTEQCLDMLSRQQKGDILIVSGQLGKLYEGSPAERWGKGPMVFPEFGAHTVAAGSILLTHPERLAYRRDHRMTAAGDEFRVGGAYASFHVPIFQAKKNRVELIDAFRDDLFFDYGSVSIAVPSRVFG